MPYNLNLANLLEIQIVGRLHGQTTRNVFHYAKINSTPIGDGAAEVQAVLESFETIVYDSFLATASVEWSCQLIQGQIIKPTRYRSIIHTPAVLVGQQSGSSLPSGVCSVISTYAEPAGRQFQGRKYFPGIPVVGEADSKLSVGQFNLNLTLAGQMRDSLAGVATAWFPWVNMQTPTLDQTINAQWLIESTVVRDTIRYQRRREVGVGE